MAISDNCVNMHVQHIQWRSDCLVFYFGTSKVNQTGDSANDPLRVYSNPQNTKKNLVLALDTYLLYNPDILTTSSKYLRVTISMKDFEDFHKIINNNLEEL